jgi:hypothetical protein
MLLSVEFHLASSFVSLTFSWDGQCTKPLVRGGGLNKYQPVERMKCALGERVMADEDLRAELERLKAENTALKNKTSKGISIRVSEKGGVSVYGLGRFPVTLYKEQWNRLLDIADDIRAFIAEHEAELKTKGG